MLNADAMPAVWVPGMTLIPTTRSLRALVSVPCPLSTMRLARARVLPNDGYVPSGSCNRAVSQYFSRPGSVLVAHVIAPISFRPIPTESPFQYRHHFFSLERRVFGLNWLCKVQRQTDPRSKPCPWWSISTAMLGLCTILVALVSIHLSLYIAIRSLTQSPNLMNTNTVQYRMLLKYHIKQIVLNPVGDGPPKIR